MAVGVTTFAPQPDTILCTWASLAGTETGQSVSISRWPIKTIQASGTFTTITPQGSNDGVTWFPLNDPQGVDIAFAAVGMAAIQENPVYIRVLAVGAAGCTVILLGTAAG